MKRVLLKCSAGFSAAGLLFASTGFLLASIVFSYSVGGNLKQEVSAAPISPPGSSAIAIAYLPKQVPVSPSTDLVAERSLEQQLSSWVSSQPISQRWGITVKSLDDQTIEANYKSQAKFNAASIFKLYVIYGLNKTVPFDKWQAQTIDGSRTYAECVQAIMSKSDNPCAVAIGDLLSWDKINKQIHEAGYINTSLSVEPTLTTVEDTARLLGDVYQRRGFSNEASTLILEAMSHSAFRRGIVAGCPDCQTANKTGDGDGFVHDAGIVTINGKHYVLAVFSEGGSQKQIAEVARLVHDQLLNN